jgi:hypothetical protein
MRQVARAVDREIDIADPRKSSWDRQRRPRRLPKERLARSPLRDISDYFDIAEMPRTLPLTRQVWRGYAGVRTVKIAEVRHITLRDCERRRRDERLQVRRCTMLMRFLFWRYLSALESRLALAEMVPVIAKNSVLQTSA